MGVLALAVLAILYNLWYLTTYLPYHQLANIYYPEVLYHIFLVIGFGLTLGYLFSPKVKDIFSDRSRGGNSVG